MYPSEIIDMKLTEDGQRILWVGRETWCCHERCLPDMQYRMRQWHRDVELFHDEFTSEHEEILSGNFRCEGCSHLIRNAVDAGYKEENQHFI